MDCGDSRGDNDDQELLDSSSSNFLSPSPNFGSISAPHLQHDHTHQNPTFFDPQHTLRNLHLHHDLIWSTGLNSHDQHNYANSNNLTPLSSSLLPPRSQSLQPGPFPSPSDHASQPSLRPDHPIKNPKKRARAPHQAPTTVLKTDTTNFRQMVQEYTGISPYPLQPDLFSDALGPVYPIGPSEHKFLSPFPPLLNSTVVDSVGPTANNFIRLSNTNVGTNHLLNLQHDHNIPLMTSGELSGFRGGDDGEICPAAAAEIKDNDNREH